jgi:hypothetical protein
MHRWKGGDGRLFVFKGIEVPPTLREVRFLADV